MSQTQRWMTVALSGLLTLSAAVARSQLGEPTPQAPTKVSPEANAAVDKKVVPILVSLWKAFVGADATLVEVNPLAPEGTWDWFCLDSIPYRGRALTIVWDKTGAKFGKGQGLRLFANGREIAHSAELARITGQLP